MMKSISNHAVRTLPTVWLVLFLVAGGTITLAAAEKKYDSAQWEPEIKAFEAADKINPPPKGANLFVGSSSIRLWKTLPRDFPEHKVINRGFGGSQIIDSVRFAERVVLPYQPKRIVFYAGGNDINAGKAPEEVCADFKAFVEKVRGALPETRIAYISIAPNPARWAQAGEIKTANRLIEDFTKSDAKLSFVNVFPRMLGEDARPRPDIFGPDRLHMNTNGYALWKEIMKPVLDE